MCRTAPEVLKAVKRLNKARRRHVQAIVQYFVEMPRIDLIINEDNSVTNRIPTH
jgi:hypothetical protein